MGTMHRLLLIFILTINVALCYSQNREEIESKTRAILGNLYQDVKYQDESINYQMQITIGACAFELLVNDMVVYRDPGYDASASVSLNTGINEFILQSGTQTWELRVYPPKMNDVRLTALPEGVAIMVRLEAIRYVEKGIEKLMEPVYLIRTPQVEKQGDLVYADAGKPMMVYKGVFEAKVPYQLTGWSKSKDLRKMDQNKLQEMVLNEYRTIGTFLQEGNLEQLALRKKNSYIERAQSLFYTPVENEVIVNDFIEVYGAPNMKTLPIENYKMTFWGNGRVATLERTDYWYNPALITDVKIDGKDSNYSYYIFLHIPEGSEKLEIIR